MEGELREFLEILIELRKGVLEAESEYLAATAPYLDGSLTDTSTMAKDDLPQRLEILKRWRASLLAHNQAASLQSKLQALKEKLPRSEQRFADAALKELEKSLRLQSRFNELDLQIVGLIEELFHSLGNEWDRAKGGESLDEWRFSESAIEKRKEETIDHIIRLEEEQEDIWREMIP